MAEVGGAAARVIGERVLIAFDVTKLGSREDVAVTLQVIERGVGIRLGILATLGE